MTVTIKDNFSKKNYVQFRLGKILVYAFFKSWHSLLLSTENSSTISKGPDGGHSLSNKT